VKYTNVDDFTSFFLRLRPRLLRYALSFDIPEQTAEDAVMHVYAKVLANLREDPQHQIRSFRYLQLSVKNYLLDQWKRLPLVLPQHQDGSRGFFTGTDISQKDLAERGIGNFPTGPDLHIWVKELEQQFGGTAKGARRDEVIDIVQQAIFRFAGSEGDERQPHKVQDDSDDNLLNWYLDKYGGQEYEEMLDRAFYDAQGYADYKGYRRRVAEKLTKILQRHEAQMREWAGPDRWLTGNPKYIRSYPRSD
jgi:hypothetical protein